MFHLQAMRNKGDEEEQSFKFKLSDAICLARAGRRLYKKSLLGFKKLSTPTIDGHSLWRFPLRDWQSPR